MYARKPGQSIVEFGLVFGLLTLLIAGMFEFGLLLNLRVSASSMSRELARSASLGATGAELAAEAKLPSNHFLGVTTDTFSSYCCDVGDAVVVKVSYYPATCASNCIDKTRDGAVPGDRVEVIVTVMGADVVTPVVRKAFVCTGPPPHCFQQIPASTNMRFEGPAPS